MQGTGVPGFSRSTTELQADCSARQGSNLRLVISIEGTDHFTTAPRSNQMHRGTIDHAGFFKK